jgi:hypothetical protein
MTKQHQELRAQLAADTAAFIAAGGNIQSEPTECSSVYGLCEKWEDVA